MTALSRLDCRVRLALRLLRAGRRSELAIVSAMTFAALAAAWPVAGDVYSFVAIPSAFLLAALIRLHADGLDNRRLALEAAGANPQDTAVITAVTPLAAAATGSIGGAIAAIAADQPQATPHALLPLLIGAIATLVLRPRWIGAPALAAGTAAAAVAAVAIAVSTTGASAGTASTALVASATSARAADAAETAWSHGSLPAVAAALVLVAAQVAGRKRQARSRA
jgi:hypothetical protein